MRDDLNGRVGARAPAVDQLQPDGRPDGEGPGPGLAHRQRRSEAWLARVAVEAVRRSPIIHDSASDDDELLLYVASIARKCAAEGTSAEQVLSQALGKSLSTIHRLRKRAVAAGYLDAQPGGRPRKTNTPK